jgi:hypothetical protein
VSSALSDSLESVGETKFSRRSKSPSSSTESKSLRLEKRARRVFWRRNQSSVQFERMRWKQHRQLGGGLVAVVLRELHHAVLHDIERRFFIPHVIDRALESASFDAFQEIGEFLFSGQARGGAQGAPHGKRGKRG